MVREGEHLNLECGRLSVGSNIGVSTGYRTWVKLYRETIARPEQPAGPV